MVPFADKLRALRALQNLSQTELAEKAGSGVSQWDVTSYERGLTPTPTKRQALETALGIKFDDPEVDRAFLVLAGQAELAIAA